MSTSTHFINEEIEVRFEHKPGPPTSFIWRDQEYKIEAILEMHRKLDFKRAWWQRGHLDYYVVRTHTGQIFELHFHRGPGRKHWVLYKEFFDELQQKQI